MIIDNLIKLSIYITDPTCMLGLQDLKKKKMFVDIESGKIIQKESVRYSPGLERIFVEAVSNAIDNVWRSKKSDTPSTKIKINIDKKVTGSRAHIYFLRLL